MSSVLKAVLAFAVVIGGGVFALHQFRADRASGISVRFWSRTLGPELDRTAFQLGGETLAMVHDRRELSTWFTVYRDHLGELEAIPERGASRERLGGYLVREEVPLEFAKGTAMGVTYLEVRPNETRLAAVEMELPPPLRLPEPAPEQFEQFFADMFREWEGRGAARLWATLEPEERLGLRGRNWAGQLRSVHPPGKALESVEQSSEDPSSSLDGSYAPRSFDLKFEEGAVIRYAFLVQWNGLFWRTSKISATRLTP